MTNSASRVASSSVTFWFILSLSLAVVYSIPALREAFSGFFVVQDDARQHVFWMQRFVDSNLFPKDLMADYFQSVAPAGYTWVYRLMAIVGIEPLLLHKLLPPVLGGIATCYCFGICVELLPIPISGFIGALLLNQTLWMRDDIVAATPVAFVYPLLLAFLYYLLKRNLLGVASAIALIGLFYPQCVFVCSGVLILQLVWHSRKDAEIENFPASLRLRVFASSSLAFYAITLAVAILILLPYAFKPSEFGTIISAAEAKTLPAFLPDGWSNFFDKDPVKFWFCGKRSGMLPTEWCGLAFNYSFLLIPPQLWAALALPILLRNPQRFPLVKQIRGIDILPQILIASLSWFLIAHALLFKLHLPNRYTEHSFRIVVAIAASITIASLLDTLLNYQLPITNYQSKTFLSFLIAFALFLYPPILKLQNYSFAADSYVVGEVPALYKFFQSQPKDITIASIAKEANNLPSFAHRSILVGGQGYALPYHKKYYAQIQQRTLDMINAQYSIDLKEVQRFIQTYGVDLWLLDRAAFTLYYVENNSWMEEFQAKQPIVEKIKQGTVPALSTLLEKCSVFDTETFAVLQASCIVKQPK
ncbi:hypothetical protein [Microseira wollei]|uniref:hypothetical protein n=1 Tax=Microseira wollei TaxID=467598 RepID=UPI001CFE3A7C|nr:hypothetical protein [Microseira wollei]